MHEAVGRQLSFIDAVREGLEQAMDGDPSVIVIGEGVPDPKAIFTSTEGLQDKFGSHRVFDMPLAENGLTGICIGAALTGMRPVMIHQRIDFAMLAMDQIINNAAKWHYMFNGKASVPLVIRMIVGRGWGQGPQHSQSLQALFAHIPGLRVIMPTTAHDAKGMMISAIEDNNPVLFIEHRWLHHVTDYVPKEPYRISLNKGQVLKEGNDVTLAAFSHMVFDSLIAAKGLIEHMGVSVEVIDMRSVRPLDMDIISRSVRKTGYLIVADTAHRTGGIAGELVAQAVEYLFDDLKASPVRIASPDYPVPTSPFMASEYYPTPKMIADAVLDLVKDRDNNPRNYEKMVAAMTRSEPHDVPNLNFSGPF